uniref:Uncharacterized protein n=1 Tax=Setaria viridis TaxID=4556 RepID=A0A4V6D842_SETVI|nr:hypothetical protein SEVIR_4G098800v2 [Setaria viridis]
METEAAKKMSAGATDMEEVASLITRILATHPGPGRRFSAHVVHLLRRPATVDAWLQSPALDGLEELEFDIGGLYEAAPELPLPASAFRFSATLRGALYGVIAGCPVLESLLLTGRSRFSCIRINSQSLVSLGLRVYTEELIIEDAPLLERLLQLEFRIATHLSELSAASSVTVVSSVKNLAINIPSLSIDMFVDLMKCFPCLEKLYIQRKDLWQDDVIKSLGIPLKTVALRKCFDICLKIVVLKNYQGIKSQVNFARFFVLNVKVLESIRFEGGTDNDKISLLRLLQLEQRALRGIRFYFTGSTCCHYIAHTKHVGDFYSCLPVLCLDMMITYLA